MVAAPSRDELPLGDHGGLLVASLYPRQASAAAFKTLRAQCAGFRFLAHVPDGTGAKHADPMTRQQREYGQLWILVLCFFPVPQLAPESDPDDLMKPFFRTDRSMFGRDTWFLEGGEVLEEQDDRVDADKHWDSGDHQHD